MGAMMHRASFSATFAVMLAAAAVPAPAQPAGERLAAPPLAGFVQGYQAGNADQSIREEIPRGEKVQRWSRMVTTQRFTGLAARTTPAAYARTIIRGVPAACPAAGVSPIANLTVSQRPAARFQVDCPRNQAGQAETFILLAIAGQSDMHVKQVAFRGPVAPGDLAWARGFLAAVTLCRGTGCR